MARRAAGEHRTTAQFSDSIRKSHAFGFGSTPFERSSHRSCERLAPRAHMLAAVWSLSCSDRCALRSGHLSSLDRSTEQPGGAQFWAPDSYPPLNLLYVPDPVNNAVYELHSQRNGLQRPISVLSVSRPYDVKLGP
jgi:hypothetical protein